MRKATLFALVVLSFGACKKQVGAPAPEPMAEFPPVPPTQEEAVDQLAANFARIHFELDSSSLDGESKRLLEANAAILQEYPDIRIEVQGHADERGTTDYNLALGMRRAEAVRGYMLQLGIAPSRVTTISFGEERPLAEGSGESVWARNRRAEFRVLTPGAPVQGSTG